MTLFVNSLSLPTPTVGGQMSKVVGKMSSRIKTRKTSKSPNSTVNTPKPTGVHVARNWVFSKRPMNINALFGRKSLSQVDAEPSSPTALIPTQVVEPSPVALDTPLTTTKKSLRSLISKVKLFTNARYTSNAIRSNQEEAQDVEPMSFASVVAELGASAKPRSKLNLTLHKLFAKMKPTSSSFTKEAMTMDFDIDSDCPAAFVAPTVTPTVVAQKGLRLRLRNAAGKFSLKKTTKTVPDVIFIDACGVGHMNTEPIKPNSVQRLRFKVPSLGFSHRSGTTITVLFKKLKPANSSMEA